jgi:hypothetical protein
MTEAAYQVIKNEPIVAPAEQLALVTGGWGGAKDLHLKAALKPKAWTIEDDTKTSFVASKPKLASQKKAEAEAETAAKNASNTGVSTAATSSPAAPATAAASTATTNQ